VTLEDNPLDPMCPIETPPRPSFVCTTFCNDQSEVHPLFPSEGRTAARAPLSAPAPASSSPARRVPPAPPAPLLTHRRVFGSAGVSVVALGMARVRGRQIAHAAVSRRPPSSLSAGVALGKGYTYATKVWVLSIVQGPFSVAPCQTLCHDSQLFASRYASPSFWRVRAAGAVKTTGGLPL
jgi:hypothetical protein